MNKKTIPVISNSSTTSVNATALAEVRKVLNTIEDESTETESEPTSSTRRQRSSPMKVVYEDEQPNIRSRSTSPPTIVTPKRKRSVPSNLRRQLENQESTGPSTSSERRSSDPTIRKKGKTDEQLDHYHEKIREKYRNIQKIQEGVEEEDEDEEDDDMPSTSSALPSSSRRQSRRRSSTGATNRKRKYTRRAGSPAVFAGNLMKKVHFFGLKYLQKLTFMSLEIKKKTKFYQSHLLFRCCIREFLTIESSKNFRKIRRKI